MILFVESRIIRSTQSSLDDLWNEKPWSEYRVTESVNALEFVVLSIQRHVKFCFQFWKASVAGGSWQIEAHTTFVWWLILLRTFFLQRILYHHPADVQLVARPCDGLPERLLQGPLLPADQTLPQASAPGRKEQRSWVRHQRPVRDPSVADQPHQETGGRELWWSVER